MITGTCHPYRASGVKSASLLQRSLFLLAVLLPALAVGQTNYTPYTFTTVAGLASIGSVDSAYINAQFNRPATVAVDSAGNLYVADTNNSTIRKITLAGVVTTLAGSPGNIGSTDGTGSAARFFDPAGLTLDSSGNLYVADTGNSTIRMVTAAGVVTTLAGLPGAIGYTEGTGQAARFDTPIGITVDSSGNVYVADAVNNTIRKITPAGAVTTLAGLSMAPSKGSTDGTATAARFYAPRRTAVDSSGNVYVADTFNHVIRKITAAGVVTTLAGSAGYFGSADGTGSAARFDSPIGITVDGSGNVYVADTYNCTIRKVTPASVVTTLAGSPGYEGSADGTGSAARFALPGDVAVDGSSNVYVADTSNHTIRKVSPTGVVTTLAGAAGTSGSTNGTGTAALFDNPLGLTVDSGGNVYVADAFNYTIRKITSAGVVTTMVGTAGVAGSTDGTGTAGLFAVVEGVAVDNKGNLYVADTGNETIRMVTSAGVVTTLAGTVGIKGHLDGTGSAAQFSNPTGLAVDSSGNLYVADYGNNTVRKVTPGGAAYTTYSGVVSTLAGSAGNAGYANGTGGAAQFNNPAGLTFDSQGNLYVADTGNNTIRKITSSGMVTTAAGSPTDRSNLSRNGQLILARFNAPNAVAVDSSNNLYVADTGNSEIRLVTAAGVVSTLAGTAGLRGFTDGVGSGAHFNIPEGLALDSSGNVYVADTYNDAIREVTPSGQVATVAGLTSNIGNTDGTNSAAQFNQPMSTAVDGSGNVYVADSGNSTIRVIAAGGGVTTLAGSADYTGSTDGTGTAARLNVEEGVALDSAGNIYVADSGNNTIRMITPAGVVSTLAGMAGTAGTSDGTGTAAQFIFPTGIAVDNSGSVYVADAVNNTIRKITSGGVVTTLAGSAGFAGAVDGIGTAAEFSLPTDVAVDSSGNVYVTDSNGSTIRKITSTGSVTTLAGTAGVKGNLDGIGTAAQFNTPQGLSVDSSGNVYVADTYNNTIRMITAAGVVTTLAGSPNGIGYLDGTGGAARFNLPRRPALDSAGNLYVADTGNNVIRKITPAGVVTTLAGTWYAGSKGDSDGKGMAARFNEPQGVAVDGSGNLYVADTFNGSVRKITPDGTVATLAGSPAGNGSSDGQGSAALFFGLLGVAADSAGNVYVADAYNSTIRSITPNGTVTTLAGMAQARGSTDGTGSDAYFFKPTSVAYDGSGNLYVADTANNTIRKVTLGGVVTTLAGTAGTSGYIDAIGTDARFSSPAGVAADSSGNVYVADTGNNTIRKVTAAGAVTTLAGSQLNNGSRDGTGRAALFATPTGIAVDISGNVYVADVNNDTIRKVTPAGVVTTIGGAAGIIGSTDGTGSGALFNTPYAVAVDNAGNIYVADTFNNTIRKGVPASGTTNQTTSTSSVQGTGTDSSGSTGGTQTGTSGSSGGTGSTQTGTSGSSGGTGTTGSTGSSSGTGSATLFRYPTSVIKDSAGNLYVADASNNIIQKVTSGGLVSTLAGSSGLAGMQDGSGTGALFNQPNGIALDSAGNVYVADTGNATIRRVTSTGVVTTVAGTPSNRGNVDGTGTAAQFNYPLGIAVDGSGNLYVADAYTNTIRKITSAGVATTFAGAALIRGDADGAGSAAQFNYPSGVAVDTAGNVYVADTYNDTIRRITAAGTVSTLAGSAGISGANDGTGIYALFNQPVGVTVDGTGNVYVADTVNCTIRKVASSGAVTTLAGTAGIAGLGDGAGSSALFNQPRGITVDSTGNLYVADTGNATIRQIAANGMVTTPSMTLATTASPTTSQTATTTVTATGGGSSSSGGGAMEAWFVGTLALWGMARCWSKASRRK
jgi:streptogramin lyase